MINYKAKSIVVCCLFILTLTTFNACKKYLNSPQVFEDYGADLNGKTERKVLIININGLGGQDLQRAQTTNITEMLKTSKYNLGVLSDINPGTSATLATMFTGVSSVRHLISDDSFLPKPLNGDDHSAITKYPTIFSRMLDVRPEFKTAVVTTDQKLSAYLIHADRRVVTTDDSKVKDSTVNILNTDVKSRLIVADFRGVEAAGLAGGYSVEVPGYKDAVTAVDTHIGALLSAIRARKNYTKEDWLVMVTTNRGGASSNPKPGFIICYNPALKSESVKKVGFNTMRFNNTSKTAIIKDDGGLYDAGADKDFTVQYQIKFNVKNRYPGFFSKSADLSLGVATGWVFLQDQDNFGVVFGGSANGGAGKTQISGGNVADGKWHTVTLTVKLVGAVRTATVYTDGVAGTGSSTNIAATKSLRTTEPMKIGFRKVDGGAVTDFFMADLLYFNQALDAEAIRANLTLKDITKHPKYNNLIGYWPLDDGGGSVIANKALTGYNFQMTSAGTWEKLGNDIPVSRERQEISEALTSIINTGPDVTALTYYWLKVPVKEDWGLEGAGWLSNFELEFVK
jgi:hypothetical protein